MHFNTYNHRPLHKGIIETLAKLDVQLALMDHEDADALGAWIVQGGMDVSISAKSLLLADILAVALDGSNINTITKKASTYNV